MQFETIELEIDGVRTVIKIIGQGAPVLSLHGAGTLEGQEWARGLADRFCVYLPFHPGFGESGPAPHICGMQDMVIHYLRLITLLKLYRPHLVGHSMGGWMAAELAAFAGERFGRLVLNAPAGLNHPDHPNKSPSKLPPEELPRYFTHRPEIAAQYFPGGSLAPPPEQFFALRAKENKALEHVLKAYGPGHPNLGRWISRIPNETLVIWGEKDSLLPASQAPVWAERISRSRVHIVPGVGHLAMQEDPSCVTVIGDFLAA